MDRSQQAMVSKNRARRPTPSCTRGRKVTDLKRAVIELAEVRGWHVPPADAPSAGGPLCGLVYAPPMVVGSEGGWPDLTLIRSLDRRLVFAALASDRATTINPRKRLVLDLLGSLRWNASTDERRRAEQALGHPVPWIEAFVWRPADLVTGTIEDVLR
jgi:hypothetical protein